MRLLLLLCLIINSCIAQNDSCSGSNPPYPPPPHCDNFSAQDSIQVCYTFIAPDSSVYLNPFVLSTCSATNLDIYLYNNTCSLVTMGTVGYNTLILGDSYTVCFKYTCDLSGGLFSGVCFFDYLPIELLYWDAKKVDEVVKMGWSTASEINNEYFAVERSTNGKGFYQLGIVDGAGNSTTQKDYSYTDYIPYEQNYYRLAQHDYDGKIQLSEIRYVNMKTNCCIQVFDIMGRQLYLGHKADFHPTAGVYIIIEDGHYKKYLKPQ